MASDSFTTRMVVVVLALWCAAAVAVGALGMVASLRPPFPQVVLFGLVGLLFIVFRLATGFRSWLYSVPLGWLISVHLVRLVGIYFLRLHEHGRLPFAFAVPGGWGDIAVASLAAGLLAASRWFQSVPIRLYLAWNILGLADILFVVVTAARLALADARSMSALGELPLSLLPTFVVPLIIFTHVVIFFRLARLQRDP